MSDGGSGHGMKCATNPMLRVGFEIDGRLAVWSGVRDLLCVNRTCSIRVFQALVGSACIFHLNCESKFVSVFGLKYDRVGARRRVSCDTKLEVGVWC